METQFYRMFGVTTVHAYLNNLFLRMILMIILYTFVRF